MDIKKSIFYLHYASLLLLFAIIPIRYNRWQSVIYAIVGILYMLDYIIDKRWQQWKWDNNKWFFVLLITYFLCIPFWQLFSKTNTNFVWEMGEFITLILVGIVGLLGINKNIKIKPFAITSISASIFLSIYIIIRGGGTFFSFPMTEQTNYFAWFRIMYVNHHMQFNLFLNVSLIFAFYLFNHTHILWRKILIIIAAAWIFYLLFITEGRIGLLTCAILSGLILLLSVWRKGWKWWLPIILILVGGFAYVSTHHSRINSNKVERDPRWAIWKNTWTVITDSPVLGHGVSGAREQLITEVMADPILLETYVPSEEERHNWSTNRIQPHNAFLQTWSEFGIFGLVILLAIFAYPVFMRPHTNRKYIALIIIAFVIQCCFDSFFAPLFYGLCILILTSQNDSLQEIASQKPVKELPEQ